MGKKPREVVEVTAPDCGCYEDVHGVRHFCFEHAPATAPEITGFALEEQGGKFRACRISTHGDIEYIGPKGADGARWESKASALARVLSALEAKYAAIRMRVG